MNTRDYYYFVTLVESGSIQEASRRLHVTPAALSKFLLRLQQQYDVPLFQKPYRTFYPTAAGMVFYRSAKKILSLKDEMVRSIRERTASEGERLRIAIPPNLGFETFQLIFTTFHELFPHINLVLTDLQSMDQIEAIRNRTIDAAFGVDREGDAEGVDHLLIGYGEIFLAVPRTYPLAQIRETETGEPPTIRVRDLSQYSFVLRDRKYNMRRVVDRLFLEAGFTPHISFESSQSTNVVYMIQSGMGIGFLSKKQSPELDNSIRLFHLNPPAIEQHFFRRHESIPFSEELQCLVALYTQAMTDVIHLEPVDSDYMKACYDVLARHQREY